jgi:hypothetical protein
MLCVTLTNAIGSAPIAMNNRITVSRLYLHTEDIPTFPNRLVFKLPQDRLEAFVQAINGGEDWLDPEAKELVARGGYGVVPFTLRVGEEAHKAFTDRADKNWDDTLNNSFKAGEPRMFIKGKEVPTICHGCKRRAELKGNVCPDYEPGTLACLNTPLFAQAQAEAIYLNEKGELFYAAAPVEDIGVQ